MPVSLRPMPPGVALGWFSRLRSTRAVACRRRSRNERGVVVSGHLLLLPDDAVHCRRRLRTLSARTVACNVEPMSTLHAYWSGVLRRLQAEVDAFAQLVHHHGEQGRENEMALARLLTSLIPARFGTGSGLLIDRVDTQSPQTDVIVYELAMEATLFAQTNQVLFPIESCYAAIEVKTTLSAEDVADFGANSARLAALQPARSHLDGSTTPVSCLVAYSAWARPETVFKHLVALDPALRPDLICIVDAGCVGGRADLLGWTGDYGLAQTFLYEPGDPPTLRPAGRTDFETIGNTTYTVYRVDKSVSYLVDAARALLIFLEAVLKAIHAKADGRTSILSLYLTDEIARVDLHMNQIDPPRS